MGIPKNKEKSHLFLKLSERLRWEPESCRLRWCDEQLRQRAFAAKEAADTRCTDTRGCVWGGGGGDGGGHAAVLLNATV